MDVANETFQTTSKKRYSRLPIPDSRLPTPDSRLPTPDSVTQIKTAINEDINSHHKFKQ
ncbi:MAG: hypothetical protein F6K38_38225 [Moorea sp. SIO3B2]|nr:hypothetical protein [Moorena sp. SIO3B2]NEQ12172.1 hypothetical protein [Moorena sp. SIO4E2]